MPTSKRPNTLSSLIRAGVYVNDYPGLILDGVDVSFFHFKFVPDEVQETQVPGKKPVDADFTAGVSSLIARYNEEYKPERSEDILRLYYLDDQWNCIMGMPEHDKEGLKLTTLKRLYEGDRILQLSLSRVYTAEGTDGAHNLKFHEVKPVYEAIEKFIATYQFGWLGLFKQYDDIAERMTIFRNFRPFRSLFNPVETLKKPAFLAQLGVYTATRTELFKWIRVVFGEIKLDYVVNMK